MTRLPRVVMVKGLWDYLQDYRRPVKRVQS